VKTFLVQRVLKRETPSTHGGVDKYFAFDYMGSSEFEWGQLPKALKELKDAPAPQLLRIKSGKYTSWFVGKEKHLLEASDFFKDQLQGQLNQRQWRLKESSGISSAYEIGEVISFYARSIAWWSVDMAHPWIIFKFKKDARLWLKSMKEDGMNAPIAFRREN